MAFLTLCGRRSAEFLGAAGAEGLPAEGSWQMISVADDEGESFRCIAICRRRFGELAFDLCCNARLALEVYGALYRITGISPAGQNAWESLRIESGTPGVPGELYSGRTPLECGFPLPADDREFTGRAALQKQTPAGKLIIAELERYPLPPGTVLMIDGGIAVGAVTSGAFCPVAGKALVFAFADADSPVVSGCTLFARSGENTVPLTVKTVR
jgi:glycine cleavage system aminomethyltransferase T